MAPVVNNRAAAVFQQIPAVNLTHDSRVCHTFGIDDWQKIHYCHAARLVVVLAAEQLGQRTAVYVTDISQRGIQI